MFKKIIVTSLALALTLVVGLCYPARAFTNTSSSLASPRVIAMGGAYVAVANDSNAVFLNPAGLGNLASTDFSAIYGALPGDTRQYCLVGSANFKDLGKIGIGYYMTVLSDEPISWKDGSTGDVIGFGKTTFQKGDLAISYGYSIFNQFLLGIKGHKLFQVKSTVVYSSREGLPLSDYENNGEGYGLDFGVLWKPFSNFHAGLLIENFYATDFILQKNDIHEKIPKNTILGLAYWPIQDKILLAADFRSNNIQENSDIDAVSAGGEIDFIKPVKIRFGYLFEKDSSSNYVGTGSAGIGLNLFNNLRFDYAFRRSQNTSANSDYFALGYRF